MRMLEWMEGKLVGTDQSVNSGVYYGVIVKTLDSGFARE